MSRILQVGEIGVLQHLNRQALNGMIAEVTGELKMRMLYSLHNPADSEICLAYKVRVPGFPAVNKKIEWCVKAHQLRAIDGLGDEQTHEQSQTVIARNGVTKQSGFLPCEIATLTA